MKNSLLVLYVIFFLYNLCSGASMWSSTESSYDGLLEAYLNPVKQGGGEMSSYKQSLGVEFPETYYNFSQSLSKYNDQNMYGIYVLDFGNVDSRAFAEKIEDLSWSLKEAGDRGREVYNYHYLNLYELSVLELYGDVMTSKDLNNLSLLKHLKILGLPKHGISFAQSMKLPSNLEVLVVRNSILNESFFEILETLPNLDTLILKNCHLDVYEAVIWMDGRETLAPFVHIPVWDSLSEKLKNLKIVGGSRSLVTTLNFGKWRMLKRLEVRKNDHGLELLLELLSSSEGVFKNVFPVLETLEPEPRYKEIEKEK